MCVHSEKQCMEEQCILVAYETSPILLGQTETVIRQLDAKATRTVFQQDNQTNTCPQLICCD